MSSIPSVCTLCLEDFTTTPPVAITGQNHPHKCFFHANCLEQSRWRDEIEDEIIPFQLNYPHSSTCPNDRCIFTHIDNKEILFYDSRLLEVIATIASIVLNTLCCHRPKNTQA